MDALLLSLGLYAVNCAGRLAVKNGIAYTAQYTTKQCSRLLKTVDDKSDRQELRKLQKLLDSKIKILSPAIALIEFKSGRGNAFLEPAVPLAKSLQRDIAELGERLETAAATEETTRSQLGSHSVRVLEQQHLEVKGFIQDIKTLLARIDQEIQFIQLAITASGETLSSSMPPGISPSRLMQASACLNMGDCQFAVDPTRLVQIGPSFTISLYMLFVGHGSSEVAALPVEPGIRVLPGTPTFPISGAGKPSRQKPYGLAEGERKPIWQEVIHKARFRICRTPLGWIFDRKNGYGPDAVADSRPEAANNVFTRPYEYSYHLEIVEDLDDGRLHDEEGLRHQPFDNIPMAGICESLDVSEISKIFYTDTGKLLNIGSSTENNPVLLLKRDVGTTPSLRQISKDKDKEQQNGDGEEDTVDSDASNSEDYDQTDVDQQLLEEVQKLYLSQEEDGITTDDRDWRFPPHVDQEWLALEVFVDDDEQDSDDSDDDEKEYQGSWAAESNGMSNVRLNTMKAKSGHAPSSSVNSNLLEQIRNMSIRSPTPSTPHVAHIRAENLAAGTDSPESLLARSPFGNITSSLSLLEMLIRLTSLQQFQQVSHLAIPDYILTFFLEETSTTGLTGEQRWRVRSEAEKRVGFDPYTDTPTRDTRA